MDPIATNVMRLLEQLDDEVDDLEETLAPILKAGLADTASKLPLLDKAKLYVLITYAVESILFSYLRLHGVNAREHPVFVELTRVKQYFDKIKRAENPVDQKPGMVIDKSAAHRFVRAGLAGNDKLDFEREERLKKEKAKVNIKFADHEAPEPKMAAQAKSVSPAADSSDSREEEEAEVREVKEAPKVVNKTAKQQAKDRKIEVLASRSASQSKESTPSSEGRTPNAARKKKKQNKRKTHRKASEGR